MVIGLSNSECHEYITDLIGLDASTELSSEINIRTQGNLFFIKQMLTYIEMEKSKSFNNSLRISNAELSGEYQSLEYYIKRNLRSLNLDMYTVVKYMVCYGKPIDLNVIALICDKTEYEISCILNKNKYYGYIIDTVDGLRITHDKISQAIHDDIVIEELNFIHKKISDSLLKTNNVKFIFDATIQRNLSKSTIKKSEILDIAKLNFDAANLALNQLAYSLSNTFYIQALHYIELYAGQQDSAFVNAIKYGYIYTSFLTGDSIELLKGLRVLIVESENIVDVTKYYALYKDIIVNSNKNYDVATSLGVELLSKFNLSLPSSQSEAAKFKLRLDSINIVSLCYENLKTQNLLPIDKTLIEKSQLKLMQDLWEAAYYSQDVDIMQAVTYKILDLSISTGIHSESSFGFMMYAMLLSKQGMHEKSYRSGKFALYIVDKYADNVMFPKITNLFCNYSAFYSESFLKISERYYSSYKTAVLTSDFLFGAWAAYFRLWTLFLSGTELSQVLSEAKELFDFLSKTNDEKMIHSYFILSDAIYSLTTNGFVFLQLEKDEFNVNTLDDFTYFNDISFAPGAAWLAIINVITNYIYGKHSTVIESIDLYLSDVNIDIVMFPLMQVTFYEALSLIEIYSEIDEDSKKAQQIKSKILDKLSDLSSLAVNEKSNFGNQFKIVKLSLLLKGFKSIEIDENSELLVHDIEESGSHLEKGILYELLTKFESTKGKFLRARNYLQLAVTEFELWGATNKKSQLLHVYANLNDNSSAPWQPYPLNQKLVNHDFNKLLKSSTLISSTLNSQSMIQKTIEFISDESSANQIYFISFADQVSNASYNSVNGSINHSLSLNLSLNNNNMYSSLIHYCYCSKTSIFIDASWSESPFMTSNYVVDNSIKSIICIPVLRHNRVLAVVYLESSNNNLSFTAELFDYLILLLNQLAISLTNSQQHNALISKLNEQSQVQNKLTAQINKIKYINEYSNLGVWSWDINTQILEWSDEIFSMFGYAKFNTDINFDNFMSVIHPDDRQAVKNAIQYCFDGHEYMVDHRIIRPDGSIRWLSEKGNVVYNTDNTPVYMFGIVQDITDTKAINDRNKDLSLQLNQSHKMESIGQLTGGIAHDFNNILASVLGYSELMQTRLKEQGDEKLLRYLDNIHTAGQRAKELVAQMMLFSRTKTDHNESISLQPIIRESIKLLTSTIPSGIKLSSDIDVDIPEVIMDPIQAQQIIMNLCVNSRDAIVDIGHIHISLKAGHFSLNCSSCHVDLNGEYVNLVIQDNGSGIEPSIPMIIVNALFSNKTVDF